MSAGPVRIKGPKYNRKIGSGSIKGSSQLGRGVGRQTASGTFYLDVRYQWNGKKVEADVTAATVDAMETLLNEAVRLTKLPGWTPFLSGDLMNSITNLGIIARANTVQGEFGSPLYYSLFQELGTIRFAGRFYLTRAGTLVANDFNAALANAVRAKGY